MLWTWVYQNADGTPLAPLPPEAVVTSFASQSDAENYIGESWQTLLDGGVAAVTLYEGDHEIYGPMSIKPAE